MIKTRAIGILVITLVVVGGGYMMVGRIFGAGGVGNGKGVEVPASIKEVEKAGRSNGGGEGDIVGEGSKGGAIETANGVKLNFGKGKLETYLGDKELVTVDYPQEQIRVILRNLGELYDLNLVIPDTLVGSASIKLKNVSWRQIFDIILKPVGYTYVEDNGIVKVMSVDQVSQEAMVFKTFPVKYAKAEDLKKTLEGIIKQRGGSVEIDSRSNSLVVRDRPSSLLELEKLLKESNLDKPVLQVMLQTKFFETGTTRGSDTDGAGFDFWGTGAIFGATASTSSTSGSTTTTTAGSAMPLFSLEERNRLRTAILTDKTYAFALNALQTDSKTKLVASPTLVTLNNQKATFLVGKKQPIIQASYDTQTGQVSVGSVNYLPVGVQLDVTPRVNEGAEQITLSVNPKISRIEGTVSFNQYINYPIEATREVSTNLIIKNGYTLAIGGLMQDDKIETTKRVPLLGDIPGVGRLFQNKRNNDTKVNLIMFITARVLDSNGSTYQDVVDPRLVAKMGVTDDLIPGYESKLESPGMVRMGEEERALLKRLQDIRNEKALKEAEGWMNGEIEGKKGKKERGMKRRERVKRYKREG